MLPRLRTVAGYPNLFLMVGPNTGLGHNSIVFMIEAQLNYVCGAVKHLQKSWCEGEVRALDLRADVQAKAYRDIQNKMRKTVWMSGCKSWYQSADGHIDTLWPGFTGTTGVERDTSRPTFSTKFVRSLPRRKVFSRRCDLTLSLQVYVREVLSFGAGERRSDCLRRFGE